MIRKLEAKASAGINRVQWDLRYESPRLIALRTTAPDNPHIWEEPRFRDSDSRPITHWGTKPAEVGPIVAPGKYTVRLKVEDQSYTQPLTILRDPRSPGSDADIELSVKTSAPDQRRHQPRFRYRQPDRVAPQADSKSSRPCFVRRRKKEKEKPAVDDEDDEGGAEPAPAPPRVLDEAQSKA